MTTLHALKHVANALRHAEALADEAEDLNLLSTAARLRHKAADIAADVDEAVAGLDEVGPARLARNRAHERLGAAYADGSAKLYAQLPLDRAAALTPGGHLDVVERVRFRLRQLAREETDPTGVRAAMQKALDTYEVAVDAYLVTCARAQGKKDEAIAKSQALRVEMVNVKARLLCAAELDEHARTRIKGRTVRTKRPRWIDEARMRQLLATSEGNAEPMSQA